ncbi:response regulator transcription factor [Pseudonocardia sichuanensis]|uniref:Two-component system response regulator QseB n=1 Tax=Pseudonocardia kunmingensis TaxID=630975 RepID=A0A543E419_9PSEU|nr:response regulator transcription factor [Pseudonocardia kunmingensis]TQM16337.1 two-component system response regulator QseB [Pseudonocardia kunmingensis]
MLPAAPPGGASSYTSTAVSARVSVPPNDHVLLALPPTAASASVLRSLRSEGVSVSPVSDGIGVLDAVRTRDPALVVLDVDLPGPDQAAVLAALQAEAPNVPVIAVTPRERRIGLLGQLRGDRDDFLVRPFAVDELAARIRLRLRLGPAMENTVLRHGELVVDTEFGDVTVDGRPVALSPTEYALLMALLATPGEVVAPDRLSREVWSEPASPNLVQVYISYLRRKIGAERIRTVRGEGYVLEA